MPTTRGNVTLTDDARFEILGLVSIALPGPWRWHTADLNEPGAVGAIFDCYDENNGNAPGYLLVSDVSGDPQEPDISKYDESQIPELDRFFEREARNILAREHREMIKWMSSQLNRRSSGTFLVTAYITKDGDTESQHIDIRTRIRAAERRYCWLF